MTITTQGDLTFVRTSEPGMLGAYEVRRHGVRIGNVSAHYGRPAKSRWRASKAGTITGAYAFAPTRREAVGLLWGDE